MQPAECRSWAGTWNLGTFPETLQKPTDSWAVGVRCSDRPHFAEQETEAQREKSSSCSLPSVIVGKGTRLPWHRRHQLVSVSLAGREAPREQGQPETPHPPFVKVISFQQSPAASGGRSHKLLRGSSPRGRKPASRLLRCAEGAE